MATVVRTVEVPDQEVSSEVSGEAAVRQYLNVTDDDIIACRGWGHPWPQLRRPRHTGKPAALPRGIRSAHGRDGVFQLEITCPSCGKVRILTTGPGGVLTFPAKYAYIDPPGYKAPKGVRIPRRAAAAESWRRVRNELGNHALPAAGE